MSLQQLLRLSFANQLIWLGEEPRTNIPIQWVTLDYEEVGSGDVLLLSASELTPKLVEQICAQGGVALILWGKPAFEPGSYPGAGK